MDSQFVPYELACKLKELGFDDRCFGVYKWFFDGHKKYIELELDSSIYIKNSLLNEKPSYSLLSSKSVSAPLWQQAFDWIRKEHGLWSFIDISPNKEFFYTIKFDKKFNKPDFFSGWFETWENARLGCLSRLIKLCE